MEKQVIQEELKNCPAIVYYPKTGTLEMTGRSIQENPELIYGKLETWIATHFEKHKGLVLNFQMEYINSGSSKHLFAIMKRLSVYSRSGKVIRIRWHYEEGDEAMQELGEYYRDSAGVNLELERIV